MADQAGSSEFAVRPEGAYERLATRDDFRVATRADLERLRSTLLMAVGAAAGTLLAALAIATAIIIRAVG